MNRHEIDMIAVGDATLIYWYGDNSKSRNGFPNVGLHP